MYFTKLYSFEKHQVTGLASLAEELYCTLLLQVNTETLLINLVSVKIGSILRE
jgi:hypothetical protein